MNVMTSVGAEAGGTAAAPTGFSADEFWRMAELGAFEDMWVELVEGELQRMPPPGTTHGTLQMAVIAELLRIVPRDRLFAEVAIRIGERTVIGSDAAVVRRAADADGPVAPDDLLLVVEVAVSTADRDLLLKRRLYAEAGIRTYWVVDAARRVVHVFDRPEGGDYAGLALTRFGEALAVPGTDGTAVIG